MSLLELFLIAVGLSMDAFAVSVCKGLSLGKITGKHMGIAGAWFGGFQALMPAIGYILASSLTGIVEQWDHWIAFLLLAVIGGNMMKEAFGEEESLDASMGAKDMFPLAVATSIDALAVGVSFAFLKVDILYAVLFIGVTTFLLSGVGIKIGSAFGDKYKSKAEIAGGMVLILIGLKILLEGVGIIK